MVGGGGEERRIYCIRYIWFESLHVFMAISGRRQGLAAAPHSEASIPKPEREHKDFLFMDLKEAKQMVPMVYPSLLLSQGQTSFWCLDLILKLRNPSIQLLNGSFRRVKVFEEKRDKAGPGYVRWTSPGVSVLYTGSQDG